ncbi:MAG: rhodanese-like domain-containing protein, partial [Pseudonocardiaceae bacterium]
NYALAPMTEDEFVAVVTEGLPEPPAYFAQEVALNRVGHDAFDPDAAVPEIPAAEAVNRARDGVLLLDVRDDQAFAAGHLRGAVNVGLSGRFAEYAAAVHAPAQPVILVGSASDVAEARMRLARVGVDTVAGVVTDLDALVTRPELMSTQSRLTIEQAADRIASVAELQVVDVRGPAEFGGGTLPGAVNLPLPRLRESISTLDPARPVLVHCASGYRSIAAASLLAANGFADVSDVIGGWNAWRTERDGARTG